MSAMKIHRDAKEFVTTTLGLIGAIASLVFDWPRMSVRAKVSLFLEWKSIVCNFVPIKRPGLRRPGIDDRIVRKQGNHFDDGNPILDCQLNLSRDTRNYRNSIETCKVGKTCKFLSFIRVSRVMNGMRGAKNNNGTELLELLIRNRVKNYHLIGFTWGTLIRIIRWSFTVRRRRVSPERRTRTLSRPMS